MIRAANFLLAIAIFHNCADLQMIARMIPVDRVASALRICPLLITNNIQYISAVLRYFFGFVHPYHEVLHVIHPLQKNTKISAGASKFMQVF